jgi:hypothetical protein
MMHRKIELLPATSSPPSRRVSPHSGSGISRTPNQKQTTLTSEQIFQLQRTIGNRAVVQLLSNTPPALATQPPTDSANTPLQRSVGLELEHSIPVYQNLSGKNQEESLRLGSYEYDNDQVITEADDVTVKVDNSNYGLWLKEYLEKNNPNRYDTNIPEKGVSIVEYTTTAPGLDELASGAKDNFLQHAVRVENEVNTSKAGVRTSKYYIGVPSEEMKGSGYDFKWLQVTTGVFPSKIDALHRVANERGNLGDRHRTAYPDITGLVDKLGTNIYGQLLELTHYKSDFWEQERENWGDGFGEYRADYIAPFQGILEGVVKSILRLCISYYVGSHMKIPQTEISKNAVPLLARQHLGKMFTAVGEDYNMWKRLQTVMVSEILLPLEDTLDDAVKGVLIDLQLNNRANNDVLTAPKGFADFLTKVIKGEEFHHTGPGTWLSTHDNLHIEEEDDKTLPPLERGGAQLEFRSPAQSNWKKTFVEIGQDTFRLNTEHLPREQRRQAAERTGWDLEDW